MNFLTFKYYFYIWKIFLYDIIHKPPKRSYIIAMLSAKDYQATKWTKSNRKIVKIDSVTVGMRWSRGGLLGGQEYFSADPGEWDRQRKSSQVGTFGRSSAKNCLLFGILLDVYDSFYDYLHHQSNSLFKRLETVTRLRFCRLQSCYYFFTQTPRQTHSNSSYCMVVLGRCCSFSPDRSLTINIKYNCKYKQDNSI